MTFYRSIYVKKVMKLLAFIFEQPSYLGKLIMGIIANLYGKLSVYFKDVGYLVPHKQASIVRAPFI